MVRCVAFGCGNISFEGCLIHFHKFPLDRPDIRTRWISFCKRFIISKTKDGKKKKTPWVPGTAARLCSEHFEPSCYIQPTPMQEQCGYINRMILKPEAVPTILTARQQLAIQQEREGSASGPACTSTSSSGGACNDVDVDYQPAVKKQLQFVCTPESNPTPKAAAKLARERSAEKRRHREVN